MTAFSPGRGANVRLNPPNAAASRRKVRPQAKPPLAANSGGIQIDKQAAGGAERRDFLPPECQETHLTPCCCVTARVCFMNITHTAGISESFHKTLIRLYLLCFILRWFSACVCLVWFNLKMLIVLDSGQKQPLKLQGATLPTCVCSCLFFKGSWNVHPFMSAVQEKNRNEVKVRRGAESRRHDPEVR